MAKQSDPQSILAQAFDRVDATRFDVKKINAALGKLLQQKEPTRAEMSAFKRFQNERGDHWTVALLRGMSKKLYCKISGRQVKVINEQAQRYGMPTGRPTINVEDLIRWIHDFLAEHKHRFAAAEGDPLLAGDNSPALERYRLARAKREEFAHACELGEFMKLEDAAAAFDALADNLRPCGELLGRQFGAEAQALFDEHIDRAVEAAQTILDHQATQ